MDKDRRLAYLILKDIENKDAWSNLTVNSVLSGGDADNPAFIRELVYGVIRNEYKLDRNIDGFLSRPKIGKAERILLRMGFYQLSEMDSVPDHAAVNETVRLAEAFVKGKKAFVNAVMRNFQRQGGKLNDYGNDLSVNYSFHQSIIDLWTASYGKEKTEELLRISNTIPPFTVRINPLKHKDGPMDLSVGGADYQNGFFSVQDEASQLAVRLLAPKAGSTLIDVCAAPGGKSCAAAELMQNKGKILAFDLYDHRVELIRKEAARLGIDIIEAGQRDAVHAFPGLEGSADYVICDVPCSGLGVLRRKPEMKLKDVSQELRELPEVQLKILENAASLLKKGGHLLYSTCTVNPHENEEIVRRFTANEPSFRVETERQLFPEEGGHDGFYICIMEKE